MRKSLKTALAALALAGGAALATPASAQSFGLGIGPNGGISFSYDSGGYCDDFGCPDDFWNMPVYYGPVFYAGYWYDGPLYYRDWGGRRQFWIHGGWRTDEWRGPHPGWWRQGRIGPALGMNYYRDHGFHGRWDSERRDSGANRGRGFNGGDRRDFNRDRHDVNNDHGDRGRNDYRALDRRDDGRNNRPNAQPQQQQQPQAGQPHAEVRGWNHGRGPGQQQAAPQAQPAPQAAPQQPPTNNGGNNDHRGHRGRGDH